MSHPRAFCATPAHAHAVRLLPLVNHSGHLLMDDAYGASLLVGAPKDAEPVLNDALKAVQDHLTLSTGEGDVAAHGDESDREGFVVKELVHVRIARLPLVPGIHKANISSIRASDNDQFLQVKGTVIRTGTVKMLEAVQVYECTNPKCKYTFDVIAQIENDNVLEPPKSCPSNAGSAGEKRCKSTTFRALATKEIRDYQEVKIQEQVQSLTVGSIPRSIVVVLECDLVDSVKAGDDCVVTGIARRRWGNISRGMRMDLEVLIVANNVQVLNTSGSGVALTEEHREMFEEYWEYFQRNPLAGRNVIVSSIAPQLYGLFVCKLSVFLTLIGGCVARDRASGMRVRGQPHLLLIGDPGCGKSQFLRYAAKLVPRSVHTTGIGSTSAGLTCTAVKDSGEWMLEAGALVLADRGLCCIDEFNSIREHDRATIHEAMEQQTLSVAKAGLVCKLNARTTVLAATNPKGKYDPAAGVDVNTAIASPLLSRFDLVLVLIDRADKKWDKTVSTFILKNAIDAPGTGGARADEDGGGNPRGVTQESARAGDGGRELPTPTSRWPITRLRAYLAYVQSTFEPSVCDDAADVLEAYYAKQRSSEDVAGGRTTLRLLESLLRLTQAHARLMCRHEATIQDAVVAVVLTEASMATGAVLDVDAVLHSDFPADPDAEYARQEIIVLTKLNLGHLIGRGAGGSTFGGGGVAGGHIGGGGAGAGAGVGLNVPSAGVGNMRDTQHAPESPLGTEDLRRPFRAADPYTSGFLSRTASLSPEDRRPPARRAAGTGSAEGSQFVRPVAPAHPHRGGGGGGAGAGAGGGDQERASGVLGMDFRPGGVAAAAAERLSALAAANAGGHATAGTPLPAGAGAGRSPGMPLHSPLGAGAPAGTGRRFPSRRPREAASGGATGIVESTAPSPADAEATPASAKRARVVDPFGLPPGAPDTREDFEALEFDGSIGSGSAVF